MNKVQTTHPLPWHGKYFTLEEMTASPTARRLSIDNTPTPRIVENLQLLVDHVLDPLRQKWGQPIVVTSGYRCPKLNAVVHGATRSQHIYGQPRRQHGSDEMPDRLAITLRPAHR